MISQISYIELRFEDGPRSDETFRIDESPYLVGRDQSAHLFLDDSSVSRIHMAFVYRDGQWFLQDLGGKNQPRIHGRPTVSLPLLVGDRIQVGSMNLRVVAVRGEAPTDESRSTVPMPLSAKDIRGYRPQSLAGAQLWAVLAEWAAMIGNIDRLGEFVETALDSYFQVIPADRGGIYRLDEKTGVLHPVSTRNLEGDDPVGAGQALYSETIIAKAIQARSARLYAPETVESEDADTTSRSRSMIRKKIRNALCIPLLQNDGVRGIVYLDQVEESQPPFMIEDLELGTLLTGWLAEALEKAERFRDLDDEVVRLRQREKEQTVLIGESEHVRTVRRRVRKVAKTEVTALITGESGTGKELVARSIHEHSGRCDAPFVAINCAAIPDTLLESELFGYAPQSGIHGADPAGKPGRFELAQGGTLVLDEIGEMPLPLQAKLLRALEELVIDRLGGREPIPVDVRVIAMTNRDLSKEVEAGRFREDLYYRLHVFPIHIPPLRERPEDILPIAHHLLGQMVESQSSVRPDNAPVSISPRAIEMLRNYTWPGNVRELKNTLLEAVVAGDGRTINPRDLSFQSDAGAVSFQSLREVEKQHIIHVLTAVNGNKKKAAELLGIHRSTLYEKISEYEVAPVKK